MADNTSQGLVSTEHRKAHPKIDKCLDQYDNYVEKWWDSSTINSEVFLLDLKIKTPKHMHCRLIL
jgi:hypothetical protein